MPCQNRLNVILERAVIRELLTWFACHGVERQKIRRLLQKNSWMSLLLWMLYFQRISLIRLFRDHNRCRCAVSVAAIKRLPIQRYSVVIFTLICIMVIWEWSLSHLEFGARCGIRSHRLLIIAFFSTCYFYIFWSCGAVVFNTFVWEQSSAQPGATRREGCHICYNLSIKPRLLFSNFGCCISKASLFRLFRDHNSCRCAVWWP